MKSGLAQAPAESRDSFNEIAILAARAAGPLLASLSGMTRARIGFVSHLWTWMQATVLVYFIAFAVAALGATLILPILATAALLSWAAALIR
jgi:hypothetical protein